MPLRINSNSIFGVKCKTLSFILILISVAVLASCQAMPLSIRPALEDEGEIFLYLEPIPQEAERLSFKLEEIAAIREDGTVIPLDLSLPDIEFRDVRRQRCLAYGNLPPGAYSGLTIKVKGAALSTEEGKAALSVPEGPDRITTAFVIRRTEATQLSLALNYRGSFSGAVQFVPVFSVSVSGRPLAGVAGFVSSSGSNNVAIIDKLAGRVTGMIATGSGPGGMAIDQIKGRVYVALANDDAIDVIDVAAGEIKGRIQLSRGDHPVETALVPGGRTLLTVNSGSDTVSFIDTGSLIESARINVGQSPFSLLIDSGGRRAYVFNNLSSTLSVLDILGRTVVATLGTEPEPLRGQFNRGEDRLYVIHARSPYLTVINPRSLSLLRREYLGRRAASLKVDTRTDMLYIGWKQEEGVTVYDPISFQPVDYIQTAGPVGYMTIDGDENNLYLIMPERKTVAAINLVNRRTTFEVELCSYPGRLTVMGER